MSLNKLTFGLVLLSCFSFSVCLNVSQCHDIEKPVEGLTENVKVSTCKKVPCRARRNSQVNLELTFTADEDIDNLVNTIYAVISGLLMPFPDHDQKSACPDIYSADGKTKVGCPLKKGETYVFKQTLEILQIYPRLKIVAHWGLTKPNGKDVTCFEVPIRITN